MRYDVFNYGDYGDTICVFRWTPNGSFYSEIGGVRTVIRPLGIHRISDAMQARDWARAKHLEIRRVDPDGGAAVKRFEEEIEQPIRRPPPRRIVGGYVYFIQCESTCRIKIGYSIKPAKRLCAMQTGCPTRLRLVACLKTRIGVPDERAFHEKFAAERSHGEWFDPSDYLLDSVEEYRCDKYKDLKKPLLRPAASRPLEERR